MFRDVNLSNLENILQRNARTDRARECILRVSGGTNFENFSSQCQPWRHLLRFNVCTALHKKLWIRHLCLPKNHHSSYGGYSPPF